MKLSLLLLPFISAFVGWFTLSIVIHVFFNPNRIVKNLGSPFQGFFLKRRAGFYDKISQLLSVEILSFINIEKKITDPANVNKLLPVLDQHIDVFLREKLPVEIPMIGMLIGERTIAQVKAVFIKELEELFPILMKQYMETLKDELDFKKIISEKAGTFSLGRLKEILRQNMSAELRLIKILGAFVGFVIGLLQVFITIAAM